MGQSLRETVRKWVIQRGQAIRETIARGVDPFDEVDTKSNRTDLVTNMDRETEVYFREKIQESFPDDRILGEEGMGEQVTDLDGAVWIIDPIDGTANFVLQRNHFGIMIARYLDGVGQFGAIYDVMADDYFDAFEQEPVEQNGKPFTPRFSDHSVSESLLDVNTTLVKRNKYGIHDFMEQSMGLRIYGAASLEILAVAKGELGAYITPTLKPWDVAAGKVIIERLGLKCTQFDGSPVDVLHPGEVIIAYPTLQAEFVEFFKQAKK